jgi:hypothetical protein
MHISVITGNLFQSQLVQIYVIIGKSNGKACIAPDLYAFLPLSSCLDNVQQSVETKQSTIT